MVSRHYLTGKPPNYDWQKPVLLVLALLIILALIFTSCNPYKQIAKRIPTTSKDSARLLHAALAITNNKPDTGTLKPGVVITLPDSSEFFKRQADSIGKTKTKIIEKLKVQWRDTCETIIDDSFGEGEKFGFDEGYAKGKGDCPESTKQVDTVYKVPNNLILQLNDLQVNYGIRQNENTVLTTKLEDAKSFGNKWFWIAIGLMVGIGAGLTVWIKNKFSNSTKLLAK